MMTLAQLNYASVTELSTFANTVETSKQGSQCN